jgi:hypothetical protein
MQSGWPRGRKESLIKMNFKYTGCEGGDCIQMAQDKDHRSALVKPHWTREFLDQLSDISAPEEESFSTEPAH